jgi:serine/threonine-protein kinase PknK
MTDKDGLQSLQATLDELRAINNLIDRICRVRETNHIMTLLATELARLTSADQAVISLLKPMTEEDLETVVRTGQDEAASIPFKVSSQISGWVIKNKRTLNVLDLDTEERFRDLDSDSGRFKRLLCCPMVVRSDVIGIVSLVRDQTKKPFDDSCARLAGIIASQSAHILSNAALLEELAKKNELLTVSMQQLKEENTLLRQKAGDEFSFEKIVGKSGLMRQVLTMASQVAANDFPVLIAGPTGTGKELIAQAIHYNSQRRKRPFVIKNCGVKTESLLESELFGHVKGAFTGADSAKPGLFREADGGTIFLDEVGDAPLSTQVAILRAIETGEIRPVGASRAERVDVRVISATNRNLKELVEKQEFRQDLFYRLNTFTIEVPPLARRPDDIPLLVERFLAQLRIKLGREELNISSPALNLLCSYSWPGNVRQLENELERAAVVCGTAGTIEVSNFSPDIVYESSTASDGSSGKLRGMVDKLERETITAALARHNGNIQKTSDDLGLTRKGLRDKMSRYGIPTGRE